MKTFSRVVIATFAMVGLASAQPKAGSGAGAPASKAAPKAAAPAKETPADARKQAIDQAKAAGIIGNKDAKAGEPAPEPPKPPKELAEMAKTAGGTWKCTGQVLDPATKAMGAMKATTKSKLDLDGWWLQETIEATMGKAKYKGTAFTTYDAGSKKWRRVAVSNDGAQMMGTSDGLKDNKIVFNLDTMGPMGGGSFRDTMDLTDPKAPKMWGEVSMDKGKSWTKIFEMSCKR